MAIGLGRLQELKSDLEQFKAELVKAQRAGDLQQIDAVREKVSDAEVAYHDAVYGQAQGFAGEDRTPTAVKMRDQHDITWNQDREQAVADWREARAAVDERTEPDMEWDSADAFYDAQQRVQAYYGPDAGGWDWEPDPDLGRDSRGR